MYLIRKSHCDLWLLNGLIGFIRLPNKKKGLHIWLWKLFIAIEWDAD
jgi:hypothetical protein